MESELFGHVKGSFSGAVENKKGLVELADGGTAFFDEIGDLPLEMQVKLLRLMQEREFRAVGSLQWRKVDLRIIAATHRDLKAEVAAGRFRQDLYYRLNVFAHPPAAAARPQGGHSAAGASTSWSRRSGLPRIDPARNCCDTAAGLRLAGQRARVEALHRTHERAAIRRRAAHGGPAFGAAVHFRPRTWSSLSDSLASSRIGRAPAGFRYGADIAGDFAARKRAAGDSAGAGRHQRRTRARRRGSRNQPHHAVPQNETIRDRVDAQSTPSRSTPPTASATNSPGSDCIRARFWMGWPRAHPETRFDFCYRPHRYLRSRGVDLPANVRRRLLAGPFGPRGADLFHGLNQRLPQMPMRRTVATFHDLFVMTGEYSTAEFRARFTEQARDAAVAGRRHHRGLRVHQGPGGVAAGRGACAGSTWCITGPAAWRAAAAAAREGDSERGGDPEAQEYRAPGGGVRNG